MRKGEGKGKGTGKGTGMGGSRAPRPPPPRARRDVFLQFDLEVRKKLGKRDMDVEDGHWSPCVHSLIGLACNTSHEVTAVFADSPLAKSNAEQSDEYRARVGDVLISVDGTDLPAGSRDWRLFVDKQQPACTLTFRRRNEKRQAISLMLEGDCLVGTLMSGAEAFTLPADQATGSTVGVLRDAVAQALNTPLATVTIYDCGRLMEEQELVADASLLMAKQVTHRTWTWDPTESDEVASAMAEKQASAQHERIERIKRLAQGRYSRGRAER